MGSLYIGLMSGTSLDGVDGVLVDLAHMPGKVLAYASTSFPEPLRREFLALNSPKGSDELHRAALAGNALARLYADVVRQLLDATQRAAPAIEAIGAHGQTVRHRPGEFDGTGYTLQINQPALLAELTGIRVVADFRSRDLAAGGQGAPLVPPFHRAWFGTDVAPRAILNIGGIANLTVIHGDPSEAETGFDCGPGNALMDGWVQRHRGTPYDAGGHWAKSGRVHAPLLRVLLDEPYFRQTPPKSTGRDLFNLEWLERALAGQTPIRAQDVQATLCELTAQSCALAIQFAAMRSKSVVVCGGGALNADLLSRLQQQLPDHAVATSDTLGLPPLQVEAAAFAWLARNAVCNETSSVGNATGARGARVLGAIYPA